MVVGILTHYNVNNQGAQLQMYALRYWLEDLGHRVVILTYEKNFDFDKSEEQKNSGSMSNFGYYVKNYLMDKGVGLTVFNVRKVRTHRKAFAQFETEPFDTRKIDCVIIGSDEVFSIDVGCNKMMYGHGLHVPAIAYAPAFGRSTEALLKEFNCYDLICEGLSNLLCISSRDTHTQSMIRNMTGRTAPLVCDPVLLYDGKNFRTSIRKIKKRYMIIYSYDRNMTDPQEIQAIKLYAKEHKLLTVSLGTYHRWCDRNIVCNAKEWYSYFADAQCVVTDTFHGSVVAMKNHCKAAFFIRESINAFKMKSLLETTGLQAQRVETLTLEELEKVLSQEIDYAAVDQKIKALAEESGQYLKDSLNAAAMLQEASKQEKKNITAWSRYSCSGCGACTAVCPAGAVKLDIDRSGFFAAVVDKAKCTNCGLCRKVCARYDTLMDGKNLHDVQFLALQSNNPEIVHRCSSGGLAHELAIQSIKNGKKVIGAVYNIDNNRVEHRIAEKADQIAAFDGSKYLQSNPQVAFANALMEAKKNPSADFVVFGTPCQITGLAKCCRQLDIRDQFLLVELFCHGVPSYKLWEEECKKISRKLGTDKYDSVQFRYKKNDWHSYCLRADAGEKTFLGARETEIFWQVFFENILLGDSCYQCRMRKDISIADIRLGDYWGRRFQHRADGVSAVFVCTERGRSAMHSLEQRNRWMQMEAGTVDEMLTAQNMEGYHHQELHDKAMAILRSEGGVLEAVKMYRRAMTGKQKWKRMLLCASSILPDKVKVEIRRLNSNRVLRR